MEKVERGEKVERKKRKKGVEGKGNQKKLKNFSEKFTDVLYVYIQ